MIIFFNLQSDSQTVSTRIRSGVSSLTEGFESVPLIMCVHVDAIMYASVSVGVSVSVGEYDKLANVAQMLLPAWQLSHTLC